MTADKGQTQREVTWTVGERVRIGIASAGLICYGGGGLGCRVLAETKLSFS